MIEIVLAIITDSDIFKKDPTIILNTTPAKKYQAQIMSMPAFATNARAAIYEYKHQVHALDMAAFNTVAKSFYETGIGRIRELTLESYDFHFEAIASPRNAEIYINPGLIYINVSTNMHAIMINFDEDAVYISFKNVSNGRVKRITDLEWTDPRLTSVIIMILSDKCYDLLNPNSHQILDPKIDLHNDRLYDIISKNIRQFIEQVRK